MEELEENRASGWKVGVKFTYITASLTSRIPLVSTQIYCMAKNLLSATVLLVAPLCKLCTEQSTRLN